MPFSLKQHEEIIDSLAKDFPQYSRELIESSIFDSFKDEERLRCKKDLFYLAQDVLGYKDLTPAHEALCSIVQSVNPLIMRLNAQRLSNSGTHISTDISTHIGTSIDAVAQNPSDAATTSHGQTESGGWEGGRVGDSSPPKISTKILEKLSEIKFTHPAIQDSYEQYLKFNEESRMRLFLMFRGGFKSTIITIAHTIQLMLIYPDIRILIASHKKEGGSQKFLHSIKEHFIRNERFRSLFPDYCPKPNQMGAIEWGTTEQVTLPNRSSTAIFPEATIEISGLTSSVTGRHYNYIKADDLVTLDSVTNETMLQSTDQYAAQLQFLFDQPEWGVIDYIGTPYHFADLYASLRESKDVTSFILPIWDKEHNPTVPERFTQKGIEFIKNSPSMTSFDFSAQHELNPIPLEDQTFRPEYWKKAGFYYDTLPTGLKIYVLVDPANTQRKESDYTALITIGIDPLGDMWLIDIIRDKLTLEGRAKLVYKILNDHEIHQVHYESVGFQSSDIRAIKDIGQKNDWYINVNEIKASRQSKEDRIRGLQYFYEQGKVHWPKVYNYFSKYHNRNFDMVDVMRREMWMFPKCEKDDLADCHSFILRSGMLKASSPTQGKGNDDAFMWWRQQVIEAKKKIYSPFNGSNKSTYELPSRKSYR